MNLAIDIVTLVVLEESEDGIQVVSEDLPWSATFKDRAELMADSRPQSGMIQLLLEHFPTADRFRLRTKSWSPVGGGLGGSSSLMVSLLKAFSEWTGQELPDVHGLVHRAHNLEARLLGTPTGTQDYYPAASGGLNILEYGTDGIRQEILDPDERLRDRMILVYTGRSHHSGLNNFEVLKGAVGKDAGVLAALHELKVIADETAAVCRSGDWEALGGLFRREFKARVRLAPAFTCPEIEELDRISRGAGAEAVKICGAGGGGCVMVWCPPGDRERISTVCRNAGFQVLSASPVSPRELSKESGSVFSGSV